MHDTTAQSGTQRIIYVKVSDHNEFYLTFQTPHT